MSVTTKRNPMGWLRKLDLYFVLFLLLVFVALFLVFGTERITDTTFYATKMDIQTIAQALELYRKDHGDYPATADMPLTLVEDGNGKPAYLDRMPKDSWGQPYVYERTPSAAHPFILYSAGANRVDEHGLGDDIDYWKVKE